MHDMFDSQTECAVRQLHGTELSYDAPQLKECSGLQSRIFYSRVFFVCLFVSYLDIQVNENSGIITVRVFLLEGVRRGSVNYF